MATDSLPPIPTPASQRWREFRIQVLPVLMFVSLLASLTLMWRSFVQPAGIIGEVQAIRASVLSLMDGVLAELTVDLFEPVTKDQVIGRLIVQGEDFQNAAVRAAQTELLLTGERVKSDKIQDRDSFSQLKTRLAEAKILLALAEIDLHFAQQQFDRNEKLHKEKLLEFSSPDVNLMTVEVGIRDRDKKVKEVEVRRQLVQELQQDAEQFKGEDPTDQRVEDAIAAQSEALRAEFAPQQLRAPIDGRISSILKSPGEKVMRGEPIVTVSAPTSDRVIGYIRQPISNVPTTNDLVRVRTRSQKRLMADCKILYVGPSLEPITNFALLSPDVQRLEVGLPILVGLPGEFRLIPGEFVDLSIQYSKP